MKSKQLIGLVIGFAVLLVLAVVKNRSVPPAVTVDISQDIISPSITLEDVSVITLSLHDPSAETDPRIVLAQSDAGRWVVRSQFDAAAQSNKIDEFLKTLDQLRGQIRSTTADVLSDYKLTDEQAIHINLQSKKKTLADILVGAQRAGWQTNFVRRNGENTVYAVDSNLLGELGFWQEVDASLFTADQWLDKRVVPVDPANIEKITLSESGQDQAAFVRVPGPSAVPDGENTPAPEPKTIWQFVRAYDIAVDQAKVAGFLSEMSTLSAEEIVEKSRIPDSAAPQWQMQVQTADQKTLTLTRYADAERPDVYLVTVSDVSYAFTVARPALLNVAKTDGDFFVDNPLRLFDHQIASFRIENLRDGVQRVFERSPNTDSGGTAASWYMPGVEAASESIQPVFSWLQHIHLLTVVAEQPAAEPVWRIIVQQDALSRRIELSDIVQWGDRAVRWVTVEGDPGKYAVTVEDSRRFAEALAALPKPESSSPVSVTETVPADEPSEKPAEVPSPSRRNKRK